MDVLSVCNHKGGTGKTTTAIHVAAALGLSGWSVLVIDLDPQGFLTRTMDVEEPRSDASVAKLFEPSVSLDTIPVRHLSGFDLLPSSSTLTKRMRDLNKPTDVLWVREVLQNSSLEYDLVLFDTAAAVTVYSLNALVASEHVLIPVLPEYQAIVGAEQTFQTIELVENKLNPRLQSRNFLLTQVDARKRIHRTYQEYLRTKYGDSVLDSVIRTSTSLAESREGGTTVFDHDSSARGAQDYANATDELTQRLRSVQKSSQEASPVPDDSIEAEDVPLPDEVLDS
ncbi:MAG: ParA family protein [Bacteroidetes bacterium SW_9_63_38]|nr:MAG: ParA family protein [Bacteroidetes bacterium SW_9_63_38]